MEVTMIRANIVEDREATMARFLAGLNWEIRNGVEQQHYVELEDMVHMAIKMENQIKRRGTSNNPSKTQTSWKQPQHSNSSGSFSKGNQWRKEEPSKGKKWPLVMPRSNFTSQGKSTTSDTQNRDQKCFKCQGSGHIASECPNNRGVMIIRDDGEVETEDEADPGIQVVDDTDDDGEEMVAPAALTFVARRALQRENIFHTRCHVRDKVRSMIIDGGSCTNVARAMVERLGLTMLKHPKPYRLQWLNDSGVVKVLKQVKVLFCIGKYDDEVLCDVVQCKLATFCWDVRGSLIV